MTLLRLVYSKEAMLFLIFLLADKANYLIMSSDDLALKLGLLEIAHRKWSNHSMMLLMILDYFINIYSKKKTYQHKSDGDRAHFQFFTPPLKIGFCHFQS